VPTAIMIFLAQRGDPMPIWVPFLFVAFWVFVSRQVAQTGWRAFAEKHGRDGRPKRPSFGSPQTRFNGSWQSNYANVVRVVPTSEGLWFSTMILFRAFHPPFIVPWTSVTKVDSLSIWRLRGYRLHIESEAGTIAVCVRWTFREVLVQYRPELLDSEQTNI